MALAGRTSDMPWRSMRAGSRALLSRKVTLTVQGLDQLPERGPAIIAARHFHHLYDGAILISTIPRPAHILVALDWITNTAARVGMERLCGSARWPTVLRAPIDRPGAAAPPDPKDANRYLRRAVADSIGLLREGRILIVFPEGYPNIDPGFTPKLDDEAFLPFEPGFARLATLAERDGQTRVPIIPAGFHYTRPAPEIKGDRWRVTLRFGEPVYADRRRPDDLVADVEARVKALSR